MSNSTRNFSSVLSLILFTPLLLPCFTYAAAVGEFTLVVGDVTQTRATELIKPAAKSPIEMEDLIATDRASSTSMVFSDDSTIMLAENTKLEIKEFLFKDQSRTGIFSLMIGKVTATVKKYIGGDNIFEVHSPTAVVGVRGTGFEFTEAVREGQTGSTVASRMATVACTDGSLTVSGLSDTGAVISTMVIDAGQVVVIIGGVITISKVGAAVLAAVGRATETGGVVTTGGAGTGTGGAAMAGGGATTATSGGASGGTAAATAGTVTSGTGISTATTVGLAIGGVAVVGGAAAAISGGGGSSSGSSGVGGSTDYSIYSGTWTTIAVPTGSSQMANNPCVTIHNVTLDCA